MVSVCVITFNSAKYIIETLDSVRQQSFSDIELIISDDCSTDDTVILCQKWLDRDKNLFVKVKLITSIKNAGVVTNINRAISVSHGEWIKFVAGDDVLLNTCIQDNLDFIAKNSKCLIVQSDVMKYQDSFEAENLILGDSRYKVFLHNNVTAKEQFRILCFECPVMAPSTFIKRNLLEEMGGFDSSFSIEDYPMWLKITSLGYKIYYLNKVTIKYRIHDTSIMHSCSFNYYNLKLEKTLKDIKRKYVYPFIKRYDLLFWESEMTYSIKYFVIYYLFQNKNSFITRFIGKALSCFNFYLIKKRIKSLLICF